MAKIGRNIREQRMKKGLSQEELAERLYVTRQTISNYETGRSDPDVEMLTRLAEALDTDIQLLIYGEPKKRDMKQIRRAAARLAVILLLYVIFQIIAGYEEDAARTRFAMPGISLFMRLTGYPVPVGRQRGDVSDHGRDRGNIALFGAKRHDLQGRFCTLCRLLAFYGALFSLIFSDEDLGLGRCAAVPGKDDAQLWI